MRPQDLQDTKQLQETLQKHVKPVLVPGTHKDLTALVSAAIQLVADAAHQVARQQVVEKNSSAYSVLLDEGYRAGVRCAVPCCASTLCHYVLVMFLVLTRRDTHSSSVLQTHHSRA